MVVNFFRPVTAINEDLGRHLLLGKIILETQQVPKTNLLSYTYPRFPFINSHWLPEMLFYMLFKSVDFNGLMLLTTVTILASVGIMFAFLHKRYPLSTIILPLYLSISIIIGRSDIRPEIFSYLFLSLFLTILYAFRERYTKWILILIPLELIWVNTHIYFFTGILTIFLFLVDHVLTHRLKNPESVKILLLTLLLSISATFINPNHINGALFPPTVHQNYGYPVLENQTLWYFLTYFNEPQSFYFLTMLLLILLLLFFSRHNARPVDWLLVLSFAVASIIVYRMASVFAYTALIPFTFSLSRTIKPLNNYLKILTGEKIAFFLKRYSLVLFCLLLIGQINRILLIRPGGFGVNDSGKNSADFIIDNQILGPFYNNFAIGGYLAYRLYPDKIFIDNRPEAYPQEFARQANASESRPAIFETLDKKYNFNAVILRHWDMTPFKNPLLSGLLNNKQYRLIYLDDYAVIFAKNTSKNREIIQKYSLSEDTFSIKTSLDQEKLVKYIYFFEKAGWENKEKKAYKSLLAIDPGICRLKFYLSRIKKEYVPASLRNIPPSVPCAF